MSLEVLKVEGLKVVRLFTSNFLLSTCNAFLRQFKIIHRNQTFQRKFT